MFYNGLGIYEVPLHETLKFSTNLNRVFRIYLVSKSLKLWIPKH
jgi:hypothetical protein